jgi:hypothetical protein
MKKKAAQCAIALAVCEPGQAKKGIRQGCGALTLLLQLLMILVVLMMLMMRRLGVMIT